MANACVKKCPSSKNFEIECKTNKKIKSCSKLRSRNTFAAFKRCLPVLRSQPKNLILKKVDGSKTRNQIKILNIPIYLQILIVLTASVLISLLTISVFMGCFFKCPLAMIKINVGFFMIVMTSFCLYVTYKLANLTDLNELKVSGSISKENGRVLMIICVWIF